MCLATQKSCDTTKLSVDDNIHIVIHRQICFVLSKLFSVVRQVWFPKLGSKPGWLKRQSKILPLSHEETSASEGNLNAYVSQLFLFTYIRLTATENSIHMKSLALRLWQPFTSLAREHSPTYMCVCVCLWERESMCVYGMCNLFPYKAKVSKKAFRKL